jgi:hypothetical protein
MPGLPVCSIPQCNQNRHEGACLELFQPTGRFEPTFIEAHEASKMISNERSLKSTIKPRSFLDEIITSSNELFKDYVCDMAVDIRKLGIPTRHTAENNDKVMQNVGSEILTLQLQGK